VAAAEHHVRIVGGLVVTEGNVTGPIEVALRTIKPGELPGIDLVGIGVKLSAGEEGLLIEDVIAGGGAAQAGVQPGEEVVAIDGVRVADSTMDAAIQRLRGVEGTSVRIALRRAGATRELVVVRRPIPM
jgi:carboxyl-terminal processing protease